MTSRTTILAIAFACFATLSLAVAAAVQQQRSVSAADSAALPMAIYELPRVLVTGKVNRQPPADPLPSN